MIIFPKNLPIFDFICKIFIKEIEVIDILKILITLQSGQIFVLFNPNVAMGY